MPPWLLAFDSLIGAERRRRWGRGTERRRWVRDAETTPVGEGRGKAAAVGMGVERRRWGWARRGGGEGGAQEGNGGGGGARAKRRWGRGAVAGGERCDLRWEEEGEKRRVRD
uniref:Uncharacterized protein n=1 Tax=Oryza glumipatula TaxID=40148 RepID=A0A0D9Z7J8_9ORYZ